MVYAAKIKHLNIKYPIIAFIVKLMALFFLFDNFFLLLISAQAPGGDFYTPFIANHLNFVHWFEQFLLNSGGHFAKLFGYEYFISGKKMMLINGTGVILGFSCIGFSIMSFYLAFVIAFPASLKKKLIYGIAGLVLIITLNIMRIGGLAVIYSRLNFQEVREVDHHAVFNTIVYVIIFIIFVFYTRDARLRSDGEFPG